MGLDMYLNTKRYMSKYLDPADEQLVDAVNELFGIKGDAENDFGAVEVTFRVGYWRKANSIHQWFVKNVQHGEDDCREYRVARKQLQELVDLCKVILADRTKADDLLPTQSGFFFGGTDYDDWYFQDLEYTVERLEKVLADPAFEKNDFYYQSSW